MTRSLSTPSDILEALGQFDTSIDLYGISNDLGDAGLAEPWVGRVWLAPPYGAHTRRYMTRMVNHSHGTALVAARPETALFQRYVFGHATAALFLEGRLTMMDARTNEPARYSSAPASLAAYGDSDAIALRSSGLKGTFVWLNGSMATRTGERSLI